MRTTTTLLLWYLLMSVKNKLQAYPDTYLGFVEQLILPRRDVATKVRGAHSASSFATAGMRHAF